MSLSAFLIVRVDPDLKKQLQKQADDENIDLSHYLRNLIEEYLDSMDDGE